MKQKQVSRPHISFDPAAQPTLGYCDLEPLSPNILSLDFVRAAFNIQDQVQWQIEPRYAHAFIDRFEDDPNSIRSAVCVAVVEHESEPHIIFTRRADELSHHAGQVSFPGGRVDHSDVDAVAAALRETHEEVGIEPQYLEPLAEQPIFITTTRFAMRPVVSRVHPGYKLQPNPDEVAEIFAVPLAQLMDPQQHRIHKLPYYNAQEGVYFSIDWQGRCIWGATAAVIRNLYHYLSAASIHLGA